jgi:hypothetical protein
VKKALIPLLFGSRQTRWDAEFDFLSERLDNRISFSRSGLATMIDATGRSVYAPHNLMSFSENMSGAEYSRAGAVLPTVTINAGLAPDGTNTANLIDLNSAADARIGCIPTAGINASGFGTTMSVWLRAEPGQSGTISLPVRQSDGAVFNTVVAVTDQWQRFSASCPASFGASTVLSWVGNRTIGSMTLLRYFAWGLQIEIHGTARPYLRTAGAAFHGPRFAFDPITLEPKGLQIEVGARSSFVRNSEMVGGSSGVWPTNWSPNVQTGVTMTPSAPVVDPVTGYRYIDVVFSGTAGTTGDLRISPEPPTGIAATVGQTRSVAFASAVVAGALPAGRTLRHVVIERSSAAAFLTGADLGPANTTASLTRTAGATHTISNAACAFVSYGITVAVVAGDVCNFTIRCAAPQVEAGIGTTSYIPTASGAVTRPAESLNVLGANFSSWFNQAAGTFVVDYQLGDHAVGPAVMAISDGTQNNQITQIVGSTSRSELFHTTAGVPTFAPQNPGKIFVRGERNKVAWSYSATGKRISTLGSVVASNAIAPPTSGYTTLALGSGVGGGSTMLGFIRSLRYVGRADFSDARLQALSTP